VSYQVGIFRSVSVGGRYFSVFTIPIPKENSVSIFGIVDTKKYVFTVRCMVSLYRGIFTIASISTIKTQPQWIDWMGCRFISVGGVGGGGGVVVVGRRQNKMTG
jgi:hypothetical protein